MRNLSYGQGLPVQDQATDCWRGLIRLLTGDTVRYIAMLRAYLDESATVKRHPVMCVAGAIYEENKAIELDKKLADLYATYKIPLYHAAPCAAREHPFDHLEYELRDDLRRIMIEHVIGHAEFAVGQSVGIGEYKRTIGAVRPDLSDYEFCLLSCLSGISNWAKSINYRGKIAYIFEAGSKHQEHANRLMNYIVAHPGDREFHFYASHTFADKMNHRPLHTADLLAWETSNSMEGIFLNRDSSYGYVRSLFEMKASFSFHNEEQLRQLMPLMAIPGWGIPRLK